MKRGQLVTGTVESCDYPCKGRVRSDEGIISVKNVLPGQKVSVRIGRSREGSATGTLVSVLEKSNIETGKICANFGQCGGCAYLSLSEDYELELKAGQVKKLLSGRLSESERLFGITPKWDGIFASPVNYGYRNKMEYTFGNECIGGELNAGLHKRGAFHDILDVSDCLIVDEDYRAILRFTQDFFRNSGVPFYHRKNHTGFLRNLVVRKAAHTGEILVCPVTTSGTVASLDDMRSSDAICSENSISHSEYSERMQEFTEGLTTLELKGRIAGVVQIYCDSLSDAIIPDSVKLLYGRDHINEKLLDLNFRIGPFSFFQTNTYSAEVLYKLVRDYVTGCLDGKSFGTVYDLYCGTGTITQIVSGCADRVYGVEIVEEAVKAATETARENGINNCEFICGDVLKVLDDLTEKPDIIILDPPRDGIHPKALPKITSYGVKNIIYISCKPTSLERDLLAFFEAGYHITRYACVNQFPFTKEIETIALLSRI